ncbi:DUF4407 domain-containing protein [Actinomadura scrupuli]|uniref:DUF4407 domain-containing protein n=1 Tax=Actinomadura scrupuli TaxID=559629 RepID=UPI003D9740A1
MGDFLVFLTGANLQKMPEASRQRYVTMGALMLLTMGQACYAATAIAALGLNQPFAKVMWFGLFFSGFVFFIDRSIISHIAPWGEPPTGASDDLDFSPPKKSRRALVIRLMIAICASVLMGEAVMLQIFSTRIQAQVTVMHATERSEASKGITKDYGDRIAKLQKAIDDAETLVTARLTDYNSARDELTCQLYGGRSCKGVPAGNGPQAKAAKQAQDAAFGKWQSADKEAKRITAVNSPEITRLANARAGALRRTDADIDDANDMLSREEAFWALTLEHPSIAFWRIMLSLLLLGIDLAPLLLKISSRADAYEDQIRGEDLVLRRRVRLQVRKQFRRDDEQLQQDRDDDELRRALSNGDRENRLLEIESRQRLDRLRIEGAEQVERFRQNAMTRLELRQLRAYFIDLFKRGGNPSTTPYATRPENAANGDQRVPAAFSHDAPGPAASRPRGNVPPPPFPGAVPTPIPPGPTPGGSGAAARRTQSPLRDMPGFTARDFRPRPAEAHSDHGKPPTPDAGNGFEPFDPFGSSSQGEFGSWDDTEFDLDDLEPVAEQEMPAPVAPDLEDDLVFKMGTAAQGLVLRGARDWDCRRPFPGADGGSGAVFWLAVDVAQGSGTQYVLKAIPEESLENLNSSGFLQRRSHQKEVRMQVEHPNIGEVVDFGRDNGFYFLVSPLYRPGSLGRYCDNGPGGRRTLRWCAEVVLQVLDGLAAASQAGFVHLDIKPGNLVLDGDQIRIIDWGLSRRWADQDASYTHVPRGTLFYASPEQIVRAQPGWDTPLADLYGVGAVFYWLVTGEAPMERKLGERADYYGLQQLMHANVRPPRVDALVSKVPAEIGALVDRWLSYVPDHRIPVGTPVVQSLVQARDELYTLLPRIPAIDVGTADDRH